MCLSLPSKGEVGLGEDGAEATGSVRDTNGGVKGEARPELS